MKTSIRPILSSVILFTALNTPLIFAQSPPANSAKAQMADQKSLFDCLGSDFASYDAVLGAPTITKKEVKLTVFGKSYDQKEMDALPSGTLETHIYGGKGKTKYEVRHVPQFKVPAWIAVRFPTRAKTWQEAFERLKLSPTGVTATEGKGYTTLDGIKTADGKLWRVSFSKAGDLYSQFDLEISNSKDYSK